MARRTALQSNTIVVPEWVQGVQKGRRRFSGCGPHTRGIVTTSAMVWLGTFNSAQRKKNSNGRIAESSYVCTHILMYQREQLGSIKCDNFDLLMRNWLTTSVKSLDSSRCLRNARSIDIGPPPRVLFSISAYFVNGNT